MTATRDPATRHVHTPQHGTSTARLSPWEDGPLFRVSGYRALAIIRLKFCRLMPE